METYQSIFLVLSNLFLLPAIIWSIFKNNILDTTILIIVFVASTIYHLCLAEWVCVSTQWESQLSDHAMVYILMMWIYISLWDISLVARTAFIYIVIYLLYLFSVNAVSNWLFAISLIWFFIAFAIFRIALYQFNEKIFGMDLILTIISIILFGIGLFMHIWGGSPSSTNYWWTHSLWHVFAMLGIFVIILARDGVRIWKSIRQALGVKIKGYDSESHHMMKNLDYPIQRTINTTDPNFLSYE